MKRTIFNLKEKFQNLSKWIEILIQYKKYMYIYRYNQSDSYISQSLLIFFYKI